MKRRALLGAIAPCLLPLAVRASGIADALNRPATTLQSGAKPAMMRIARAGHRLVAVGERGVVQLSDDDGMSWRQAKVPVSVSLTGVQFVGERLGWIIGHSAVVLHTTDGGETWVVQLDGFGVAAAMQLRADQLVTAGEPSERAGKLAKVIAQDGPDKPLLDLHFADARNGVVVGAFGLMLMTRDGGASWQSRADVLPNPQGLHLYALVRAEGRLSIAGEQGLLIRTDEQATRATTVETPYRGSFFSMAALADGGLLLGGLRGTLMICNPLGEFRMLDSGGKQAIVYLAQPSAGQWVLVSQGGALMAAAPTSWHFVVVPTTSEQPWVAFTAARDGAWVGVGANGISRMKAV